MPFLSRGFCVGVGGEAFRFNPCGYSLFGQLIRFFVPFNTGVNRVLLEFDPRLSKAPKRRFHYWPAKGGKVFTRHANRYLRVGKDQGLPFSSYYA